MPYPLEASPPPVSELARVASGLSQMSVSLSQVQEAGVQEAETTTADSSTTRPPDTIADESQTHQYLYDITTLDTCISREPEALAEPLPFSGAGIGPFGPYNPPPSWAQGPSSIKPLDLLAEPKQHDIFEGKQVDMVRGKYKGKSAFVQRKVNKKYRLQVEGVAWGLEFYPNMFALPSGPM